MADDQEMSEDYILELLKKDAQRVSTSYNRNGTYDVLPKRPIGAPPKANTRFLRNIIRDTDNHNAALKQKELSDAGKRLRAMAMERAEQAKDEKSYRRRSPSSDEDTRYRRKRKQDFQEGEESCHYRRRRRSRERGSDRQIHRLRERSCSKSGSPERSHRRRRSENGYHTAGRRYTQSSDSEDSLGKHKNSYRSSIRSRSDQCGDRHRHDLDYDIATSSRRPRQKEKSPDETRPRDSKEDRLRDLRRRRSRSPDRHRRKGDFRGRRDEDNQKRNKKSAPASDDSESNDKTRHRSDRLSKARSHHEPIERRISTVSIQSDQPMRRELSVKHESDDDDPLSSFLGPKPPPKQRAPQIRGRGTTSFTSGIDERFSSTYDPTTDVISDVNTAEGEDWDQALEALRDRQRFRQAGADRLLAAGFTKEEVERMERGGERSEADVRWVKKGEAREWDRGKMIDDNEYVSVDGDKFGRLT